MENRECGELIIDSDDKSKGGAIDKQISKIKVQQAVPQIKKSRFLDYLKTLDKIIFVDEVHKVTEEIQSNIQAIRDWHLMLKRFGIYDRFGERVLTASEDGNEKIGCLDAIRKFKTSFRFLDLDESEVCHLSHCTVEFYPKSGSVLDSSEKVLAHLQRRFNITNYEYVIYNQENQMPLFYIFGPAYFRCINTDDFKIYECKGGNIPNLDENSVPILGRYSRNYEGLKEENVNPGRTFSVTFPLQLDVKLKVILLATGIYFDYTYFRFEHLLIKALGQESCNAQDDEERLV